MRRCRMPLPRSAVPHCHRLSPLSPVAVLVLPAAAVVPGHTPLTAQPGSHGSLRGHSGHLGPQVPISTPGPHRRMASHWGRVPGGCGTMYCRRMSHGASLLAGLCRNGVEWCPCSGFACPGGMGSISCVPACTTPEQRLFERVAVQSASAPSSCGADSPWNGCWWYLVPQHSDFPCA